jgi:hypothetical protein
MISPKSKDFQALVVPHIGQQIPRKFSKGQDIPGRYSKKLPSRIVAIKAAKNIRRYLT